MVAKAHMESEGEIVLKFHHSNAHNMIAGINLLHGVCEFQSLLAVFCIALSCGINHVDVGDLVKENFILSIS